MLVALSDAHQEALVPASVERITSYVEAFKEEAEKLGARLAVVSGQRLIDSIASEPCLVTVGQATAGINDIESRFADYLVEIQLVVLDPHETTYLLPADELVLIEGFSSAFPRAAFEVEEAAKCIALGRSTAAVFHAMRMLEIGIKALAKRLNIPDPVKAAERNWGVILRKIKDKIDEKWPSGSRLPETDGTKFEDLYAHLDAVRSPWRNATMHVENTYQPHEAIHILRCAAYFMRKLFALTDEMGIEVTQSEEIDAVETPNLG